MGNLSYYSQVIIGIVQRFEYEFIRLRFAEEIKIFDVPMIQLEFPFLRKVDVA